MPRIGGRATRACGTSPRGRINCLRWSLSVRRQSVSPPWVLTCIDVSIHIVRLLLGVLVMSGSIKPLTMQPTFTLDIPLDADEAMSRIRKAIRSPELRGHVASAGPCVDFQVAPAEQRFWSPHLNVQVSDLDSGSQLYCRFSPRPEVWTLFMALYFAAAFIICCAAIYGYVQWFLGHRPWSLVVIPVAALVIVSLHAASLVGQRLSSDQMVDLRQRLDQTLQAARLVDAEQESPSEP